MAAKLTSRPRNEKQNCVIGNKTTYKFQNDNEDYEITTQIAINLKLTTKTAKEQHLSISEPKMKTKSVKQQQKRISGPQNDKKECEMAAKQDLQTSK